MRIKRIANWKTLLITALATVLIACGGGSNPTTPAGYTGTDCFGSNANASNTQEDSGVALFFASFFPSVSAPGAGNPVGSIWTTVVSNLAGGYPATPLILSGAGGYSLKTCSNKYNDVTTSVMTLPRNNYGTLNTGGSASYDDLVTKVATSTAPFVGLDGFYYTANALGLTSTGQIKSSFTQGQFITALAATCPDGGAGPTGTNIRSQSACSNAAYMNNMLWRYAGTGGLFTSNTGASFEGVVVSDVGSTTALTWTRGYLLQKYASAPATTVYTMVIDAGSSGTRINFYKVVGGAGGYPQVTLLDNQKFNDNGINDFLSNNGTIDPAAWTAKSSTGLPAGYSAPGCSMTAKTTNGGQSDVGPCVIQPLLDSMAGAMSTANVPASQVKVELFATAGMRTMSQFNGGSFTDTQIASFYQTMKSYTQTTKGFSVGDFLTSNGNSQEGVWTWINLNDQYYNAFGGNTTYYSGAPTTRGDFEVGGSSMQIAFPTTIAVGDANNVYQVSINNHTYNVFSKTYLGLGGDDARKFVRSYGYSPK